MKKIYFFVFIALIAVNTISAQENIILGGAMEEEDADFWSVSNLENDPSSVTSFSFGYTDDSPVFGTDGSLHMLATNTGTNGSHLMFYQAVTLTGGKEYMFDFAAKALQPMMNSWLEVYVGAIEPTDGADYGAEATSLGGFKSSNWEAECSDIFDGTLQVDGCLPGSQGAFTVEGEGEQELFIGFKIGIWAYDTSIEFLMDNVSLLEVGSETGIDNLKQTTSMKIFPNPVKSTLSFQFDKSFDRIRILDLLGQEHLYLNEIKNQIDVSSLQSGIYILELKDNTKAVSQSRFVKE
ncbi:MAG: T9SS type A sorting domain-containing protein [Prolixibacteraceae bacterium]|jgi:hypothetical protein|nr:T9SS type A sorting domain-containing protein [Prolixibacteraceae bacterium]